MFLIPFTEAKVMTLIHKLNNKSSDEIYSDILQESRYFTVEPIIYFSKYYLENSLFPTRLKNND